MKHTMEQFKKTLKKAHVCPYCENEVQIEPHLGCCGEVHSEQVYISDDAIIREEELPWYFKKWTEEQLDEEENERSEPGYKDGMTMAKNYREDHGG